MSISQQKLLDGDLDRVASSYSDQADYAPAESLQITLLANNGSCVITVYGHEAVGEAVQRAYDLHSAQGLTVALLGGYEVDAMASFEANGLEDGARLEVGVPGAATFAEIVEDMAALNPHCSSEIDPYCPTMSSTQLIQALTSKATFEADGVTLKSWDLATLHLSELPPSIGSLMMSGDLDLSHNRLTSLPATFSSMTVGGALRLYRNELASLPANFSSLNVGGGLSLSFNKLTSLPETFGSLTVGGDLGIANNFLTSLPATFSSLTVGGCLFLQMNQFWKSNAQQRYRQPGALPGGSAQQRYRQPGALPGVAGEVMWEEPEDDY